MNWPRARGAEEEGCAQTVDSAEPAAKENTVQDDDYVAEATALISPLSGDAGAALTITISAMKKKGGASSKAAVCTV